MRKGVTWWCTALMVLATTQTVVAGAFSVSPTRIELASGQKTAVVTLTNADATPLTVQASGVAWTQPQGEDLYTDSRDLLVSPPVFTIPPGGEQIVRIALRGAQASAQEVPFRIFFQELPQAARPDFNGLNIALRVGIPVFVLPATKVQSSLSWEIVPLPDGQLRIDAHNAGNQHVQITDFDIDLGASADKAIVNVVKYVLPGSRVSWTIKPPVGARLETATALIRGSSDHGEFEAQARIAPHP